MLYHSFWKVAGVLFGIIAVLALILFGLLFYTQLRQIKGEPIITTDNVNDAATANAAISGLIPTTDQKSTADSTTNTNSTNSTVTYIPTVDDDPVIGADNAAVTIIAFEDWQCPYCAAAAPILRAVLEQYPNDVKLVYRDFPIYTIHAQANVAALAGECADDQNMFWQWHDIVYERQSLLTSAPDVFYDWAEELGLNTEKFTSCLTSEKHSAEVSRDQNAGVLAGVVATPTFFVNDYKVEGVITQEQWSQLIEALLAEQ